MSPYMKVDIKNNEAVLEKIAVLSGDESAEYVTSLHEQLHNGYNRFFFAKIWGLLKKYEIAADAELVHELYVSTFEKILPYVPRMKSRTNSAFLNYAERVILSVVSDYIKKFDQTVDERTGVESLDDNQRIDYRENHAHKAEGNEVIDSLLEAIEELGEREQELIKLRYYDGKKIDDIAKHLNITPRNVYYILKNAQLAIKSKLDKRFPNLSSDYDNLTHDKRNG